MNARLLAFGFLAAASLPFVPEGGRAEDWVTVHAWAHPEYLARRAAHPDRRETYVVAKGEYFPGATRDPSIEKASFAGVVRDLAADLTKQNYYPTKRVEDADLLIVVHWGTTTPYLSVYDMQQTTNPNSYDPHTYDFALADPTSDTAQFQQEVLHEIYDNQNLARRADAQAIDTAAHTLASTSLEGILGYTSALARVDRDIVTTEEDKTLLANLSEERYFIILAAFDLHELLQNHHKKLLWTSHMSMRAPGTNFTLAVPRMSQIASLTYGQSLGNIVDQRALPDAIAGHVKIGPIRILGVRDAVAAQNPGK